MSLSNMNPAQQARALGLVVGDTIEGVHNGCTARLTLLWLGESVAVWRVTEQYHPAHGWRYAEGKRQLDAGLSRMV